MQESADELLLPEHVDFEQLFLEPKWALSQQPMRPKAEWAIDSEATRSRGMINCFSKIQLVGQNIENKNILAS